MARISRCCPTLPDLLKEGHRLATVTVVAEERDDLPFLHLESGTFAEVAGLVVAQAHRSSGVGATLVAAAEDWAREQGMETIRVRSNVVRERAHRFYLRQGYEKIKEQAVFVKGLD